MTDEFGKWLENCGDPHLVRAYREGYDVRKGVGEILLAQIEKGSKVPLEYSWDHSEQRTSPTGESFEKRDRICDFVKNLSKPPDWICDVTSIQRIGFPWGRRTGVIVKIHDNTKKHVIHGAFNFEGTYL